MPPKHEYLPQDQFDLLNALAPGLHFQRAAGLYLEMLAAKTGKKALIEIEYINTLMFGSFYCLALSLTWTEIIPGQEKGYYIPEGMSGAGTWRHAGYEDSITKDHVERFLELRVVPGLQYEIAHFTPGSVIKVPSYTTLLKQLHQFVLEQDRKKHLFARIK